MSLLLRTIEEKGQAATARAHGFTRQTVFLVLPGQDLAAHASRSRLYDASFTHGWREASEADPPQALEPKGDV